jgi:hypothetical protein
VATMRIDPNDCNDRSISNKEQASKTQMFDGWTDKLMIDSSSMIVWAGFSPCIEVCSIRTHRSAFRVET